MKAFLEHFAAIVGAVTVAILAMSVSHEYGYFWSVGRQFQTFLTTSDYLSNGVLWLPLTLLVVYNSIDWWRLKEEPAPKMDWSKWSTWIWGAVGIVIFGATVLFFTWPLQIFNAINLIALVVLIWSAVWRTFAPSENVEEPFRTMGRQLVRVGPPLLVGMFIYGSVHAYVDLGRFDEPYAFRFKNDDGEHLKIFLRNFDKGVLLRDASDKTIEFRKWEDVVAIRKRIPDQSRHMVCWIAGWLCDAVQAPNSP